MTQLLALLERKNLCFRSFNKLCFDFIDEIARGDTSNLERFQKRRQSLIDVLDVIEGEVNQCLAGVTDAAQFDVTLDSYTKNRIRDLFQERDALVKSILDFDLRILGHIDRIKDETIQKLQSLQSGRKSIGAYKSPMEVVESAERNKALDREA